MPLWISERVQKAFTPIPRPTFGRHPFSPHAEKGERVKSLSVYGEGFREG